MQRQGRGRLALQRQIGQDGRHHGLIDQPLLEGGAVLGVPDGLGQGAAHLLGRADDAVQPRVLDHADDGGHAPPLVPQPLGQGAVILDLGRGVGAVAHLVLQPDHPEPHIARPVRQPARQEEAGQSARRLGQGQEGVGHGRRAEPLVTRQAIPAVLARRLGAGGVGAHVRPALLLGHGHADRHARLVGRGADGGIIAPAPDLLDPRSADGRIDRQGGNRGVGHGHGTAGPRIRLPRQEQDSGVGDVAVFRPVPGA